MNGMTTEERLLRNLKDAGCDDATIRTYIQLQKEGRRQEQGRLLAAHRAALVEEMHSSQYKIDCLDYLIYSINKKQR